MNFEFKTDKKTYKVLNHPNDPELNKDDLVLIDGKHIGLVRHKDFYYKKEENSSLIYLNKIVVNLL